MEQDLAQLGLAGIVIASLAKGYQNKDSKIEKIMAEQEDKNEMMFKALREDYLRKEGIMKEEMVMITQKYDSMIFSLQETFTKTLEDIRDDNRSREETYQEVMHNLNGTLLELSKVIEGANLRIDTFNDRVSKVESTNQILAEKIDTLLCPAN